MSDDLAAWPTTSLGNLTTMLQMGALRPNVAANKQNVVAADGFDPYETMLKRRRATQDDATDNYKEPEVVQYASEDIKALEEFCQHYGIFGFNCGRMHPRAALQMLRKKIGVVETTPTVAKKQMLKG